MILNISILNLNMQWDFFPHRSHFWEHKADILQDKPAWQQCRAEQVKGSAFRGPAISTVKKWINKNMRTHQIEILFISLFICVYIYMNICTCLCRYVHMSWSEESSGSLGAGGSRHLGGAQLVLWVQNSSPFDCKVRCSKPLSLLQLSIWISFVLLLGIEPKAKHTELHPLVAPWIWWG